MVGFDTFFYLSHRNTVKNDDISFLLQIVDCDSGTTSIPESGAVAGAVAEPWCHFSYNKSAFHTAAPVKRRHWFSALARRCDSGTASIPESGAVARAVVTAWCHLR